MQTQTLSSGRGFPTKGTSVAASHCRETESKYEEESEVTILSHSDRNFAERDFQSKMWQMAVPRLLITCESRCLCALIVDLFGKQTVWFVEPSNFVYVLFIFPPSSPLAYPSLSYALRIQL